MLSVARDAGDADDLAAPHGERNVAYRRLPGIVADPEAANFEPLFAELADARGLSGELAGALRQWRGVNRRRTRVECVGPSRDAHPLFGDIVASLMPIGGAGASTAGISSS
jgi:hypothetical protein